MFGKSFLPTINFHMLSTATNTGWPATPNLFMRSYTSSVKMHASVHISAPVQKLDLPNWAFWTGSSKKTVWRCVFFLIWNTLRFVTPCQPEECKGLAFPWQKQTLKQGTDESSKHSQIVSVTDCLSFCWFICSCLLLMPWQQKIKSNNRWALNKNWNAELVIRVVFDQNTCEDWLEDHILRPAGLWTV